MPLLFKPQKQKGHSRPSGSFGSQHSGPSRPTTAALRNAPTRGQQFRRSLRRLSLRPRAGAKATRLKARTSFSRLRDKGQTLARYIKNPKLLGQLAKELYQKWHLKHLIPLFFVLLYMLLGALLFLWLEAANEKRRIIKRDSDYELEKWLFVKRVEEILVDQSPRVSQQKRHYLAEAVDHFNRNLTKSGTVPIKKEPEWSFTTSMYFAGTIFTTIGYGDIACETLMGRLATIVYAIFGIPLMLITLSELGKFLFKTINEFMAVLNIYYEKAFGKYCKCLSAIKRKKREKNDENDKLVSLEKGMAFPQQQRDGMLMNRQSASSPKEGSPTKAVSFHLRNETAEEISLQMEAENDPQQNSNKSPASLQKETLLVPVHDSMDEPNETSESEEEEGEGEEERSEADEEVTDMEKPLLDRQIEAPRMHVLVALTCMFTWIFLCASLFCLWEDWSYFDSLYFMFISLLTIGLGDVYVNRRDLMMICFIFVIVGLSLVSMSIGVIQNSLEDIYKNFLLKILEDYQTALRKDGDAKNASLEVMTAIEGNMAAKFLLPLLGKKAKRSVMQQVQETARETGMEIPPIFEHFDTIDDIIVHQEFAQDEEVRSIILENIMRPVMPFSQKQSMSSRTTSFNMRENHTQTEIVRKEDKVDQTMRTELEELAIQTEWTLQGGKGVEAEQQTDSSSFNDEGIQTAEVESRDAGSMTSCSQSMSIDIQTDSALCLDEEVQTFSETALLMDSEVQTDEQRAPVVSRNQRIQTPLQVLADVGTQSDEVNPNLPSLGKISTSRLREARRKLRKAFRSASRGPKEPEMTNWQEYEHVPSSDESLDWDPRDGMHAQRRRSVKQLKRFFDKNSAPGDAGMTLRPSPSAGSTTTRQSQ